MLQGAEIKDAQLAGMISSVATVEPSLAPTFASETMF